MKKQTVSDFNQARSKVARDIEAVINDTEILIKAAAEVPGEGYKLARGKFEEKLESARARLEGALQPAVDQARRTAAAADGYVHGNPWAVIGAAAAAGLLIGFLLSRR
jgi:ElaB/YqjD/DUF883 family membrane-anchored ribosome-binding protein